MLSATWIGTLPGWATLGVLVGGMLLFFRSGGGTAIDELQRANVVLEKSVHDLRAENTTLRAELEIVKARTDFVLALAPLTTWADTHEKNAERRNEALLTLLGLVAKRMGADPDIE